VLTDNGIRSADLPKNRKGPTPRFRGHPLTESVFCTASTTTSPNPIIPDQRASRAHEPHHQRWATVERYYYDTQDQLRIHLSDFIAAYNFAKRLKTLHGLTAYEFIRKYWQTEPDRFTLDPIHQGPGLNT
jgi:hypothetical protein